MGMAALLEYRRDEAHIEEERIRSIDAQATTIASATIALAAVVVALVGDNEVRSDFVDALRAGGVCAFITLLLAASARMPRPGRLSLKPLPVSETDNVRSTALAKAQLDLEGDGANGPSAATHRLVTDVWLARGRLMKARADKKQTWLEAALFALFVTLATPAVFVADAVV